MTGMLEPLLEGEIYLRRQSDMTEALIARITAALARADRVVVLSPRPGRIREVVLGMAFVITSPIIRLAVSTVMHFRPLPVPYIITVQEVEAVGWASARIEEQGLRLAAERLRTQYGIPPRLYA